MNRPDTSLWTFCLSFYSYPQVESVCLELQDRGGVNVNSLLWAMWLDRIAPPISPEVWAQGHEKIAVWRQWVILPLRRLRRRLPKRGPWLAIRRGVQGWELKAEKRELEQLQQMAMNSNAIDAGHAPEWDVNERGGWYFLRQLLQAESELCDQLTELYESWRRATIGSRPSA